MRLWMDAGNTRLKWQLTQGDQGREVVLLSDFIVHEGDLAKAIASLAEVLTAHDFLEGLSSVAMASVLNSESISSSCEAVQRYLLLPLQLPSVQKQFQGLQCAYEDVSRFGVDRWLALLAGFHEFAEGEVNKSVCVVSCGTAMTVDATLSSGQHLGGFIVPGMAMAMRSLLGQTHSVRFEIDGQNQGLGFGLDTNQAVKRGLLFQSQAMIREVWNYCLSLEGFSDGLLILTGGDAPRVSEHLGVPHKLEQDLVLKGLKLVVTQEERSA